MSTFELPILSSTGGIERELGILVLNKGSEKLALPLAAVDVKARVVNQIAHVDVKQTFRNECTEHLEAVYIFPLAPGAAVFSFKLRVGKRVIKGIVKERGEARQQYEQAIQEGKRAALMEQERDDVFTVQVGNLPPEEEVTVEISYSEKLPFFETGYNELRLPLVVGHRFTPGNPLSRPNVGDGVENDTDLAPDASRISPPRVYRGLKSNTKLSMKVEILPQNNVEIRNLACSQHATQTGTAKGRMTISLARTDEKLDRDFVLRWTTAGHEIKSSVLHYSSDGKENFGMLSITPPQREGYLGAARDVVFVIDRSGSMGGIKMVSAVRACKILLNSLGSRDSFNIAAFDDRVEWMDNKSNQLFTADAAGIEKGEKYLQTINARGGTYLDIALQEALQCISANSKKAGKLPVIVLLTDGQVSNESQIAQRVQKEIGDTRLFIIGIDTAVNSGMLTRLARLGGGRATMVEPGNQLEGALVSISQEIGAPVVTDLELSYADKRSGQPDSIAPSRIPDLFAGRSSICFFQFDHSRKLLLRGKYADGKKFEQKLEAETVAMPALAQLWAKTHIVDLEDQFRISDHKQQAKLKGEIIQISTQHSILTRFTAFVVVDESEIVNKTGNLRKVVQPVEMPADWEWMPQDTYAAGQLMGSASHTRLCSLARSPMSMTDAFQSGGYDSADAYSGGWGNAHMAPMQAPSPQAAPQAARSQFGSMNRSRERFESGSAKDMEAAPTKNVTPALNKSGDKKTTPTSNPSMGKNGLAGAAKAIFEKMYSYVHSRGARKHHSDLLTVGSLIAEFFHHFENAFGEIKSGTLTDAQKLEAIRTKLVQGLAPLELGLDLPKLQRFLRSTAIELVSAVNDRSLTMPALKAFWQSKHAEFEEIRQETENLLSGKEPAFWDSSV
jgi:Ca-activated chloride channel family protein